MPPLAAPGRRSAGVDAARGAAVAMMVAYHLCYDLAYVGLAPWSRLAMQTRPGWIVWRVLIVSGFLLLAGISMVLRESANPSPAAFWRRWRQIAGAALLVSAASYWFADADWIYFGILHFSSVSLAAGWLLRRVCSPAWLAAMGLAALGAGLLYSSSLFDTRPMSILGFATRPPLTADYVPLFPWIGVVLIGMACARACQQPRCAWMLARASPSALPALRHSLAALGRWSLCTYLLHEPILLGVLLGLRKLLPSP